MKKKWTPIMRKYENRFYTSGIITGLIVGFMLSFLFSFFDFNLINNNKEYYNNFTLRQETSRKLLKYIEGNWASSIHDVFVTIDINKNKDVIVQEFYNGIQTKRVFRIVKIVSVDGLLGIVNLEICNIEKPCLSQEELIPLQINKIFGVFDTITFKYDSRLSTCLEQEGTCVRAFSRKK